MIAHPASGDVIRFKNGSTMRGTITQRTPTEVVVEFDGGTVTFTPDEISAVEEEQSSEATSEATSEPDGAVQQLVNQTRNRADDGDTAGDAESGDRELGKASDGGEGTTRAQLELPEAMRAVAFVAVLHEDGSISVGSGAIINPKGVIVTNYHVVAEAKQIAVLLPDMKAKVRLKDPKPYEGRVVKTDPCYDLAIVSVPAKTPAYLRFADNDTLQVGEEVRAIGNPQGLAISVSKGIVSAVRTMKDFGGVEQMAIKGCEHISDRELDAATWVQTDAAINPGNSGGPLLNRRNEMVGINTFRIQQTGDSGLNFALHVKHVRKFAGAYGKK